MFLGKDGVKTACALAVSIFNDFTSCRSGQEAWSDINIFYKLCQIETETCNQQEIGCQGGYLTIVEMLIS